MLLDLQANELKNIHTRNITTSFEVNAFLAVLISFQTYKQPEAIFEGSIVSKKRTLSYP